MTEGNDTYDASRGLCIGSVSCLARYTGKERDAESGLDYFGARYYASSMGRWLSPDWSAKPEPVPYADLSNPQTLNLYSYVHNNPLSSTDPDGHCTDGGNQKGFWWCVFHYSDQDKLSDAKSFFNNNQVTLNGNKVDPSKMTDNQLLQAWQTYNQQWQAIARTGADPFAVMSAGFPTVFRGGTGLEARVGIDIKPDANGMVQPGRGLSVNADASNPNLAKYGGAHEVESIPPELQIVQRGGDPNHYQIEPRQAMTVERFQELLKQVKLK
jgi:RHS repeat-associated protein